MPRPNETAIKLAPKVSPPKAKPEAFLLEYQRDPTIQRRLFTFWYNPQTLRFSRGAKYSSTETFAAKVQDQQYGYTEGWSLEIPDCYIDTYCMERSARIFKQGIDSLLEARLEKGEFAPPVVSFVFGGQIFAPAVVTKASWDESAWVGGDPARVKFSLSLLQIPVDRDEKSQELQLKQDDPKLAANEKDGKPRKPLTPRQNQEGSDKGKDWLKANTAKLDPQTQKLVRSGQFKMTTNPNSGDVSLIDSKGKTVAIVGRWNGTAFDSTKGNLAKIAK